MSISVIVLPPSCAVALETVGGTPRAVSHCSNTDGRPLSPAAMAANRPQIAVEVESATLSRMTVTY